MMVSMLVLKNLYMCYLNRDSVCCCGGWSEGWGKSGCISSSGCARTCWGDC